MDLSIIIVSYKNPDKLRTTLRSIFNSNFGYEMEVINVDNASQDGTAEMVEREFPKVKLIRNQNNGFAKGNNLGIRHANGKYVLLLNPDTELEPDTLEESYKLMQQRPELGAMTAKLIKGDGKLDLACRRSFPNHFQALARFLRLSFFFPKSKIFAKYNLTYLPDDQETYVDAISGAYFFTRKQILEQVGMLDEDFFMYNEDFDLCWRIKKAGWKILYYPKVICHHYKGSSSRKAPFRSLYAFADSIWIFYKKNQAKDYPFIVNWLTYIGIWLRFFGLVAVNFFRKEKYVSK